MPRWSSLVSVVASGLFAYSVARADYTYFPLKLDNHKIVAAKGKKILKATYTASACNMVGAKLLTYSHNGRLVVTAVGHLDNTIDCEEPSKPFQQTLEHPLKKSDPEQIATLYFFK